MKKNTTKKMNMNGFAHLLIAAIIVVVGVAAFGTYQIISSSAMTAEAGGGKNKPKPPKGPLSPQKEKPQPPKGPLSPDKPKPPKGPL